MKALKEMDRASGVDVEWYCACTCVSGFSEERVMRLAAVLIASMALGGARVRCEGLLD
jgi:hypothetical protein